MQLSNITIELNPAFDNIDAEIAEQVLLDEFYNSNYYLSPSALSKFLWRPKARYEWYVLNKKEDRDDTKATIEGSLIHLLMLEKDKFHERYVVELGEIVTGTPKKILDKCFYAANGCGEIPELRDCGSFILNQMVMEDYFQALTDDKPLKKIDTTVVNKIKTGDDKRLEKIITPAAEKYWEFLKRRSGKKMISQETLDYCKGAAEVISKNRKFQNRMGLNCLGNKVFNEYELKVLIPGYSFGLKGIIDNLNIDHIDKVIYLNDIKTTSDTLDSFATMSIYKWGYNYQIAIYALLVIETYKDLLDNGYRLEISFIVVNSYGDAYAFTVSNNTFSNFLEQLYGKLKDFEWSYTNRDFSNFKRYVLNEYIL